MTTEGTTTEIENATASAEAATAAAENATAAAANQENDAPASTPAEDDAAFQSGFDGVNNTNPEPKPTPEERFAGYTQAEVQAAFAKLAKVETLEQSQSKTFGMLGSLKQTIDALRAQPGTPVKLSRDSLKRLNAEYPDLADALAEDLGNFGGNAAPAVDPNQINEIVTTGIRTARQADASEFLKDEHGDWVQTVKSPEFAAYLGTLDPETQKRVKGSENPFYVSKQLTQFAEWKAKSEQVVKTKQSRLEAAIPPTKGGAAGKTGPTDEDAFMEGFKAVRGSA
jgi:hypothetical protein